MAQRGSLTRSPRFRPEADREGYVDDRASQRAGRAVVRDFDDEPDPDAEPDDEDYASLDDMFVNAYARMKHRTGMEPHDLPGHLRGAIDHEPVSLSRRVPRSSRIAGAPASGPAISDDELTAAAKDLYDRRMALHARYRNPNKIRGDVQGFIARARARRGMRTESVVRSNRLTPAQVHRVREIAQDVRDRHMDSEGTVLGLCDLCTHGVVGELRKHGFKAKHVLGDVRVGRDDELHHWAIVGDHAVDISADQFNGPGAHYDPVIVQPHATLATHTPRKVVLHSSWQYIDHAARAREDGYSSEYGPDDTNWLPSFRERRLLRRRTESRADVLILRRLHEENGIEPDSPTHRFMKDYYAETQPNPMERGSRVHGGGDDFSLSEARPVGDRIHISWIQAIDHGKGQGKRALEHLTSLADKHGVHLTLHPERPKTMRGPGLSTKQLRDWYGRHGFKTERGAGGSMVRPPRADVAGLPSS